MKLFQKAPAAETTTEKRTNKVKQIVKDYLAFPIILVVIALLATFVCPYGIVPTGSMEPTVKTGSFFFGWRLIDTKTLDRGQITLVKQDGSLLVKRLIGLPGETVSLRDGKVYIDGELLDESDYLDGDVQTDPLRCTATGEFKDTFIVPDGCYFFLGDNRGNSSDSRAWADPYVPFEQIHGIMLFSFGLPW